MEKNNRSLVVFGDDERVHDVSVALEHYAAYKGMPKSIIPMTCAGTGVRVKNVAAGWALISDIVVSGYTAFECDVLAFPGEMSREVWRQFEACADLGMRCVAVPPNYKADDPSWLGALSIDFPKGE